MVLPGSESHQRSREKLRQQFREGKLDDRMVEIEARERNVPQLGYHQQPESRRHRNEFEERAAQHLRRQRKKRKMKVTDAFDYLVQEEEGRLIDMDAGEPRCGGAR